MNATGYKTLKFLGFGMVFSALLLGTGCGTKIIRGAAPMIRMNELSHQNGSIFLDLSMRNVNGVELDINSIDVSISVNDDSLLSYQGTIDTYIVANGTETWSVEIEESQTSQDLLDSLQQGEVKSLPYSMKGWVKSGEDGTLRFEHEGHIYPVPGRLGHFR